MELNLHQRVLGYAALHGDSDATVKYSTVGANGRHPHRFLSDDDIGLLVEKFRREPDRVVAHMRNAMVTIMADERLPIEMRKIRVDSYLDDYFGLIVALDNAVFSKDPDAVFAGVPPYVPDGLSDMGKEPEAETSKRINREKIWVRKEPMFRRARSLFADLYEGGGCRKETIVNSVGLWVHENIQYDYDGLAEYHGPGTMLLEDTQKAVCRHQALYVQVLNQAFGLTGRLLKCDVNGGSHAANLVRMSTFWYLVDATSPFTFHGKRQFFASIPDREIDLNANTYAWEIKDDKGSGIYVSRADMFYRVK